MKRFFLALVCLMLLSTFVGCKKDETTPQVSESPSTSEQNEGNPEGISDNDSEIDPFAGEDDDEPLPSANVDDLLATIPEGNKVFNPEMAVFEFTEDEIKLYNEFSKTLDLNIFKNVEPMSIAKIWFQYGVQIDWEAEYTLFDEVSLGMTKEEYKKYTAVDIQTSLSIEEAGQESLSRKTYAEEILKNFTKGKLVNDSESECHIEFLDNNDRTTKFKFVKNPQGIWQVYYFPIE